MANRHVPALFLLAIAACGGSSTSTLPDGTRECHGVSMPMNLPPDEGGLVLNGMAVRDVTIFDVDVYVGALYLEQPTSDASVVVDSEQRKRIILRFLRGVTRGDVTNAFEMGFVNNAGTERLGLTAEIEQFNSFFHDVEDEGELRFDYVPNEGLTVRENGVVRGSITNPTFARAFFLVFVGPQPPSTELKAGLLGGPCD